ncbi:hypothetical protein [Streptomyces graminilatus]|uniref:hypothetical protein n=1 Tax=Streptomyces graminilatus TaxID=1464070 RepID=UPI0006E30B38|nr:hypothetical protein [Streptomyces graminilatus]
MQLTELIADAEKALKEHGDIPVVVPDTGCGCCRGYVFDPAETEVEKGQKAWDVEMQEIIEVPFAYVVR